MGIGSGNNRRRFDAAELRFERAFAARRALRKAGYLAAAAAGLVAAAAVSGSIRRWLTQSPDFEVRTFRVTGLARAKESDLLRLAGLSTGDNLFLADLGEAERRVAQHPWVRAVRASRTLPHTLNIDVREWSPAAIVDLGHLYLLSADGEVFRRLLPGDDLDLPVVTGVSREDFLHRRDEARLLVRQALEAAALFEKTSISRREPLSEVHVAAGDGVTLRLGGDAFAAKLGFAPFEEKLSRLERLLEEMARSGARAQLIHLSNRIRPGWVAVRLSQAGAFAPR